MPKPILMPVNDFFNAFSSENIHTHPEKALAYLNTIKKENDFTILEEKNHADRSLIIEVFNYPSDTNSIIMSNIYQLYLKAYEKQCLSQSAKVNKPLVYEQIEKQLFAYFENAIQQCLSNMSEEFINLINITSAQIRQAFLNYLEDEDQSHLNQLVTLFKDFTIPYQNLKSKECEAYLFLPFFDTLKEIISLIDRIYDKKQDNNPHDRIEINREKSAIDKKINENLNHALIAVNKYVDFDLRQGAISVCYAKNVQYFDTLARDNEALAYLNVNVLKAFLLDNQPGLKKQLLYFDLHEKLKTTQSISKRKI